MKHLDLFEDVPNDRISDVIDTWIKGSRNRDIMKDRLINAMTYERIAEKYDLSVRYIKTLIYKLEDKVYNNL